MIELINLDDLDLKDVYIKCECFKGMFDHELCANLSGEGQRQFFVNPSDVVGLIGKDSYALKAREVVGQRKDGLAFVCFYDAGDCKLKLRYIPVDDLDGR